jgi:hypothetical protein
MGTTPLQLAQPFNGFVVIADVSGLVEGDKKIARIARY